METRTAMLADWVFAPDWLTVEQAAWLSGHDRATMQRLVDDGCVDLDTRGLVDKRSLWEFLEALALVLHWAD